MTLAPRSFVLLLVALLAVAIWSPSAAGTSSLAKIRTSAKEYPRAQVPNYDYIERGFDALVGNPKTSPQGDMGFRSWIFESGSTVLASRRPGCDFSSSSMDMKKSSELQSSFEQGITVEGGYRNFAFSASMDYKQQEREMRTTQTVIVEATAFCTTWDVWLPVKPKLRETFKQAIRELPTTYSASAYRRFIQQFGTHYAYKMDLGGRSVMSSYFASDKYSKLVSREVNVKLAVSAKFAILSGKAESSTSVSKSDIQSVESSQNNMRRYMLGGSTRDDFDAWSLTVPENPIPVMYKLRELSELFTEELVDDGTPSSISLLEESQEEVQQLPFLDAIRKLLDLLKPKPAPPPTTQSKPAPPPTPQSKPPASTSGSGLSDKKANLARALREYMDEFKGVPFEVPIDYYPTRWPGGTYCLPTQGPCSGGATSGWAQGSRFQTTYDKYTTVTHHAPGTQEDNGVTMNFCCHKYSDRHSGQEMQWPKGSYCIFSSNTCDASSLLASISSLFAIFGHTTQTTTSDWKYGHRFIDDKNTLNKNTASGSLPDGLYDKNTSYTFCCRNDEAPNVAVKFPVYGEFWLARKGGVCQQVKGMDIQEGYIKWDNADVANSNSVLGTLPDGVYDKDTLINFCRYSPSQ